MRSFFCLLIVFKGLMAQTLEISPNPVTVVQNGWIELTCTLSGSCQILSWNQNGSNFFTVMHNGSSCVPLANVPSGYSYTCETQGSSCVYTLSWSNVQQGQNGDKWNCVASGAASSETEIIVTECNNLTYAFDVLVEYALNGLADNCKANFETILDQSLPTFRSRISSNSDCSGISWQTTVKSVEVSGFVDYQTVITFALTSLDVPLADIDACRTAIQTTSGLFVISGLSCPRIVSASLTVTDVNAGQGNLGSTDELCIPITSITMTSPTTSTVSVSEGVGSQFVCQTSRGKPAASIQWYKRIGTGTPIAIKNSVDSNRVNNSIDAATRSTLTFVPNRNDHDYQIYCTAYNNGAQNTFTSSHQPRLIVSYPCNAATIQGATNGSEYSIIDGRQQTLTCTAVDGRPLATLSWICFNGIEQGSASGTTVTRSVTWTAARNQDSQRCTCQPTYSIASWNIQAFVRIKVFHPPSPPVFTVNGQTIAAGVVSLIENSTVSINCSTPSVPVSTFTWTPQGTSATNGILTLSNVQIGSQSTRYTCIASNTMMPSQGTQEDGTASNNLTTNVLYSPRNPRLRFGSVNGQEITASQQPFSVVKVDSFSIHCEFTSNPAPSYQWLGQSGNIPVLTVTRIQRDTSWTCTATNIMEPTGGRSITRSSSVTITAAFMYGPSPPSITYHYSSSGSVQTPPELRVVEGASFSMTCNESDSKPAATYSWSGVFPSASQRLNISNIGKEHDDTDMTCTARNVMERTFGDTDNGENQTNLKLVVLYAPTVHTLSNATVVENQTFTRTCQVDPGNTTDIQYQWTMNNGGISNNQPLFIPSVSRTDRGMYRCTAWNMMNPTGENTRRGEHYEICWLNVLYGSSISQFTINDKSSNQLIFDHNTALTLSCQADSNPGSTLTFKKDNTIIHSDSDALVTTFTMNSVVCTDAGVYSCTVFNMHNGYYRPITQKNVIIRSPPIAVEPANNKTFYVAVHDNITLSLTVCAYPLPSSFKWYKHYNSNGYTSITTGFTSSYPHYNLSIVDISQADLGVYQINVDNGQGPVLKHQFTIVAQGPPEIPQSLNFDSVTIQHDSVSITWTGGFNGGLEQTFYIQYRSISETTWTTLELTDTGEATIITTLTGLSAGTAYIVRVFAGNFKGNSSTSDSVQFTTPDNPSSDNQSQNEFINGVVVGIVPVSVLFAIVVLLIFIQRRYDIIGRCRKMKQTDEPANQYQNVAYQKDGSKGKTNQDVLESNQYESLGQQDAVLPRIYDALSSSTDPDTESFNARPTYENLRNVTDGTRVYDQRNINTRTREAIPPHKVYENLRIA